MLLRLHVDEDGHVGEVELVEGSGFARLDRAAIDTVRTWLFETALPGDGERTLTHRVTFRLES